MSKENQAMALTDQQCEGVAKRLFRVIDQEGRRTLDKEQAIEFLTFMKEHLFYSEFKEERDRSQMATIFDSLPTKSFEVTIPNPDDPVHPIYTTEKRISFKTLYDYIYPEARVDGCIWIPFQESIPTTIPAAKKRPGQPEVVSESPELMMSQTETTLRAQAHLVTAQIISDNTKTQIVQRIVIEENKID